MRYINKKPMAGRYFNSLLYGHKLNITSAAANNKKMGGLILDIPEATQSEFGASKPEL